MIDLNNLDLYTTILDNVDSGVYIVDTNRTILYWSKGAEVISGRTKAEMIGKHCPDGGLSHIDLCGNRLCRMECPLSKTMLDGSMRMEKVFLLHKNGYRVAIDIKVMPIKEDGKIVGSFEIFNRASNNVYEDTLIKSLSRAATVDTLTGLPNRRRAMAYLEYRINEYKRFNQAFGILYLDIDDFSSVNNTYGHDMGDLVLKNISNSLKGGLGKNDMLARIGGEEFIAIFPILDNNEIINHANMLLNLARETKTIYDDINISPTISIGATAYKENDSIDSLIKRADNLLYLSKNSGKNKLSTDLN